MTNVFEESMRQPLDVAAVSWDKMDQAKTIIPRAKALMNTQFFKTGKRITVPLIGVRAPSVWKRMQIFTTFEDFEHGSNMTASLMIQVLKNITLALGSLPARLFIQADNTQKETTNTIVLFAAAWLLANLQGSRLRVIEFAFLMVGHTHDLVDEFFALINKALCGVDILSLPELFDTLDQKMDKPPEWHHLRDQYAFKESQPAQLSCECVKGVSRPHNYRIAWGRDGAIILECKPWLTSSTWSAPLILCDADQVRRLQQQDIPTLEPEFDESYRGSALTWLRKLKVVMETAGRDPSSLDHCVGLLCHELPSLQFSGETSRAKVANMRAMQLEVHSGNVIDACSQVMANAVSIYPSIATGSGLIHIAHGRPGQLEFREEALVDGMFVLYRCADDSSSLPVLLGRAMRVVSEAADAYVVLEAWSPLCKEKHDYRPNLFGTWLPGRESQKKFLTGRRAHAKKRRTDLVRHITCRMADVLVWPLDLDDGEEGEEEGGRIPFAALYFLMDNYSIDVSHARFTFSKRGKRFYFEASRRVASRIRAHQQQT